MYKPLVSKMPYPSIENLSQDYKSARIISETFAGIHSELTKILQYTYHFFNFQRRKDAKTARLLQSIIVCEAEHFAMLGKMLFKLGIDPVFTAVPPLKCDFFNTSYLNYSKNPAKMLSDDISAEVTAIAEYKAMLISLKNERVAEVIQKFIADEEEHLSALKQRLKELNKNKEEEAF